MTSLPNRIPCGYLAGFYELDELGSQLRRQAAQVGWDDADQQIALSDGGSGLEEFFRQNFPLAECILDFWHAAEHLTELGSALYPDDEAQRQQRVRHWCHRLKHEGGAIVVAILRQLDLTNHPPSGRQAHADCLRYFQNHQHRMDYPRYLANGWQIGSGPVKAPPKPWWPIASKAAACVGDKMAPTPSATSVPSTSASPDSGNPSGKTTQTNHNRDAHT